MKKKAVLCYVASVLFFVNAARNLFLGDPSQGVVWLCLGTVWLAQGNQRKNDDNKGDKGDV